MFKFKRQASWGWGVHVDRDGRLHDPFPIPKAQKSTTVRKTRRVKTRGRLAPA